MGIKHDSYATYKLLGREFQKRGYSVSTQTVNDRTRVRYCSPSGKVWETSATNIGYPFNSRFVRDCSINKEIASDYVSDRDMPIPETIYIHSQDQGGVELKDLLDRRHRIVIKPAEASLSRGLTIDITDLDTARAAVTFAKRYSSSVVAQQQVTGQEIRFAVLHGKVVAALLRQTPRITGDGISTVADLIRAENIAREDLEFPYISYPQLDEALIDPRHISSSDVLAAGEVLELGHATMIKAGCSIYNVMDEVHQTYIDQVEQIVGGMKAGFIVMDIFIRDHTVAATSDNHWFIEFNTAPVLKLFYGCRDSRHFDIVPLLVSEIDEHLHRQ